MSINEHIFQKIKESIDAAKEVSAVKASITTDIDAVLTMLNKVTEGVVKNITRRSNPIQKQMTGIDSDNLVYAYIGEECTSLNSRMLFGYSINNSSGYPVIIETDRDVIECASSEELKSVIADKISNPTITSWIVSMMQGTQRPELKTDEDIPF